MSFTEDTEKSLGKLLLEQITEFVSERYNIEDLYDDKYIERWLEDHASDYGYVKED